MATLSWADMMDDDDRSSQDDRSSTSSVGPKQSYACVARKNVVLTDVEATDATGKDFFDDFQLVSSRKKRDIVDKCQQAVNEWAKHKNEVKANEADPKGIRLVCDRKARITVDEYGCGNTFVFTKAEEYARRGWQTPRVCNACSQKRHNDRLSHCGNKR